MPVELAAKVSGEGPPLVIVHGLFGQARNWATLAGRFAEAYTVHVLDLRNHGNSPWDDEMSYEAMADDIGAYIDKNSIAGAAVIGHSMGGKAAMVLALDTPDAVGPLVVADIAPVTYEHDFSDYITALRAIDLSAIKSRNDADAVLRDHIPEQGVRGFLLLNLDRRDSGFAWQINIDAIANGMEKITAFPAFDDGAPFEKPTLFVAGGASDYILSSHHQEIEKHFPDVRHETIDGAGHWVHAEAPDRFFEAVSGFLGDAQA